MLVKVVRRLGVFVVTALVASVVVFLMLSVLPGDPARAQLGVDATQADVDALRAELGLNRPLVVRYVEWLGGLLHGDLGQSYLTRQSVTGEVFNALQVSLLLVLAGMIIAIVIAIPMGTLAAMRQGRPDGLALAGLSQIGISIPNFLMGLLLVVVFAVVLGWLPSNGWTPPAQDPAGFLEHLLLPALSLGIVRGAILSRYTRSAVLDIQRDDFMRTARAKGLTSGQALWRHGLRNALVPVVTVTGVEFSGLLVGAVVIETVFVIPGLGSLLLRSVSNRDMVEVQAVVMIVVFMVLLINLVVDLAYTIIDPRLRSTR
ncbi:ABC transporter permease [Brooklawnia cerclae]|uniref:Peptide/nickel transport system permease protein n=1 Tax=Brooklawnia cerclae TaxID=349934 RepID=A0ABX0SGS6_9ACTN|nr:ABC transporter permease [Brooklawnia cerclae]NIH57104.1 peptide/nickel transport system permease protein [Brooklawnia cerclae]